MTTYTLMMLEISGIQDFIFGSNNLRINISSSAMIKAVTDEWLPQFADELGYTHDLVTDADELDIASIYVGGGNAFLRMRDRAIAEALLKWLTTRLLVESSNLRLVAALDEIDWEREVLVEKHEKLRHQLAHNKGQIVKNRPMPGLGVTAACAFTGQPAAEMYHGTYVSDPIAKRIDDYLTAANDFINRLVPELDDAGLQQVIDFEHFSKKEESGYVAIVHADGNRMGERIKKLKEKFNKAQQNDKYIEALKNFSLSAQLAAETALRSTIMHLLQTMRRDSHTGNWYWQRKSSLSAELQKKQPKSEVYAGYLPFRALIVGGDDVTFVCDGRLGLALAKHYLTIYGQQPIADAEGTAVGRAGIAIVNTHFPFARGYELAERLASRAKAMGKDGTVASIDWHFGVNGVIANLDEIRSNRYTVPAGQLNARPIQLNAANEWRSWQTFETLVSEFQVGDDWIRRRNKAKGLQSALRGGKLETTAFRTNYRLPQLPSAPNISSEARDKGWMGEQCVYFDALEALDFFIPLEVADNADHNA